MKRGPQNQLPEPIYEAYVQKENYHRMNPERENRSSGGDAVKSTPNFKTILKMFRYLCLMRTLNPKLKLIKLGNMSETYENTSNG